MEPDLKSLGAEAFERLCCELLTRETQGLIADLYGRRGQRQLGVDLIGVVPGSAEIVAVECKCVGRVSAALIERAAGRFWSNRSRWRARGAVRFILCLSSDIDDVTASDVVLAWLRRFRKAGVQFEVWSATTIRRKLALTVDATTEAGTNRSDPPSAALAKLSGHVVAQLRDSHFAHLASIVSKEQDAGGVLADISDVLARGAVGSNRTSGLRFAMMLFERERVMSDWRVRRLIGRGLCELLSDGVPSRTESRQVEAMAEAAAADVRAQIVLAIAVSDHPAAASRLSRAALTRLAMSSHPQVRWQLIKRWPHLERTLSRVLDTNEVLVRGDDWIRRRFVLTLAQREGQARSKLVKLLRHTEDAENARPRGQAFLEAFREWLQSHSDLRIASSGHAEGGGLSRRLRTLASAEDGDFVELRRALDYACITLDYQLSRAGNLVGETASGEGRYSVVRRWVHDALASVTPTNLERCALALAGAADEGIRWGLSLELDRALARLDRTAMTTVVENLLGDEHPWVVRETLSSLARIPHFVNQESVAALLEPAARAIQRAHSSGWDLEDFLAPYFGLAAGFSRQMLDRMGLLLEMFGPVPRKPLGL